MSYSSARAILVNGRYFKAKSKTGRIQTAWSLAGAKLYMPNCMDDIEVIRSLLKKKGYKSSVVEVCLAV